MLCCLALPAHADIVVIAHPDCPVQTLSSQHISDLYLGRIRSLDGTPLVAVDHPRDSELRSRFFHSLNGMDLRRVNAYWARLQFSGDIQPPRSLPDSKTVIEIVRRNPAAIGYVEASAVPANVRVLLTLKL